MFSGQSVKQRLSLLQSAVSYPSVNQPSILATCCRASFLVPELLPQLAQAYCRPQLSRLRALLTGMALVL
jgi:hypothetical protein